MSKYFVYYRVIILVIIHKMQKLDNNKEGFSLSHVSSNYTIPQIRCMQYHNELEQFLWYQLCNNILCCSKNFVKKVFNVICKNFTGLRLATPKTRTLYYKILYSRSLTQNVIKTTCQLASYRLHQVIIISLRNILFVFRIYVAQSTFCSKDVK